MVISGIQARASVSATHLIWLLALASLLGACGSDEPKPKPDLCQGELAGKFAKLLGGKADDVAFSVAPAPDGGFVLAGRSDSLPAGNNRGWTARVDKYGRFLWGTDLGETAGYGAADVTVAPKGGYFVAHGAMTVMKLNEDGTVAWQKSHAKGSALPKVAYGIDTAATGGGVMAGVAYTASGGSTASRDSMLIRFNDKGEKVWEQFYTKEALTHTEDVITAAEGYLLVGWTEGKIGETGRDFWAVRTNSSGTAVWNERWGGNFDDEAKGVALTNDGGFVMAGFTQSVGAGNADMWLVKINDAGKKIWARTYGAEEADEGHGIARSGDNFLLTGRRNSLGLGPGGLWVVEVSQTGDVVWEMTYGAAWKTQGFDIVALDDGFAVAGTSTRNSQGGNDFWLVRSDENGQHKCSGALCFGEDDLSCGIELMCNADKDPAVCVPKPK